MPITLTADEAAAAMDAGSSELKFLFDREKVSAPLQAMFFHIGITTNAKLSSFAANVEELKDVLAKEFEVDAKKSLKERVEVANVICVYQRACSRTTKLDELAGELEARRMQKPLPSSEYLAMIAAWENKWWPLEERDKPARNYLEKKSDELEQGELRAEPLTSVLNYTEDDQEVITPVFDASGTLKMKKGSTSIPEPANPEQLRHRIGLLGTGLMCLAMRNPNRVFLQGLTPQTFQSYLSYILGDYVWQLTGRSSEGYTVAKPSWDQLLVYEHEIRRKAWRLVYATSCPFAQALETAWKDPVTKERFFTTPVAFAALSRPVFPPKEESSGSNAYNYGPSRDSRKGGRKGSKRNAPYKGGKGRTTRSGCATRTPEGKTICFSYNNSKVKCKNKNCIHQHVCGSCFGKHPMFVCTNGGQGPETQGAGAK